MPFISDIEQLGHLSEIARRFAVKFRLHGGVVSRFIRRTIGQKIIERPLDLFELTPFTADVDLLHSGTDAQTPEILEALLKAVPNADCFRWELRTESSQAIYSDALPVGGIIPARTLSLVDDGITELLDPASGNRDISTFNYRYQLNPLFKTSKLYRGGRDLPVFSALLYLQTLFEGAIHSQNMQYQPGWPTAKEVFARHDDFWTADLLRGNAYLRGRLRYLLINAFASAPSESDFASVASQVGLSGFVEDVAPTFTPSDANFLSGLCRPDPANPKTVLMSSSRIAGDIFRTPLTTSGWSKSPVDLEIALAPPQKALLASPIIPLNAGVARSKIKSTAREIEFLHFQLSPEVADDLGGQWRAEDLSALVSLRANQDDHSALLPLPCVAFKRDNSKRIEFRINGFDYLEGFARTGSSSLRVYIVGLTQ
jgi:hypothetical protein